MKGIILAGGSGTSLDKSKLQENGFEPLPEWIDALTRYLKEITK